MFEYKSAQCELDQYGLVEFKSKESTHKRTDIQPERTSDKYKRLSRYRDLLYWRSGLCQVSGMKNL